MHAGTEGLVAQRIDRYRRPYEGTANSAAAMQAYLDWEYGLIDQLRRDGAPHFSVMRNDRSAAERRPTGKPMVFPTNSPFSHLLPPWKSLSNVPSGKFSRACVTAWSYAPSKAGDPGRLKRTLLHPAGTWT